MKKLVMVLVIASMMLAACGGIKNDLSGNTYKVTFVIDGQSTEVGTMKFEGDTVSNGNGKSKYTAKKDEITMTEGKNTTATFFDLERDENGNYKGKAKMTENGETLPLVMDVKMKKVN